MFAGHGIAVYASSSDDEVSRLGPNGNHSMFTGALSSAIISPSIVHKGQIALEDIYRETQRLVQAWNNKIPERNNIQYTEAAWVELFILKLWNTSLMSLNRYR